jgi:hypothetical protein
MPALLMARLDVDSGAISSEQLARVREVIFSVIGGLDGRTQRFSRRPVRSSVLEDTNVGRMLRMQREQISGPYQGPLIVPPGSVMLCVGLGSLVDDLAAELLVRALRDQKIDARHVSVDELKKPLPPAASADGISMVYLVSALPSHERDQADSIAALVRERLPGICLVTVFLPGAALQSGTAIASIKGADKAATSFGHAVQICLSRHEDAGKGAPVGVRS